jgi:hypothetical protein
MDLLARLGVAGDGDDLRFLEAADIELRRRLGLVVESETGRNPLNLCHFAFL